MSLPLFPLAQHSTAGAEDFQQAAGHTDTVCPVTGKELNLFLRFR